MAEHKKYWIKIEKDFLNSSQIKVIKNMRNGKDYIIFYLALMLESTDTEGHLRFSELVPYNEEMLASVTDTNIDVVRSAMNIFEQLGLIQVLENGTLFLPDVPKRVGKECDSAERVRLFRERQNELEYKEKTLQCNTDVTKCNDNKDKYKNKNIKEYIQEIENEELRKTFESFIEMRNKIRKPMTNKAFELLFSRLNKMTTNIDEQIKILNNSILNSWQNIYELKENKGNPVQREYKKEFTEKLFDNIEDIKI